MTVAAGVSAQNVTLHRNNISVQDAITLLNEASGYSIIVNANDIDYGAKVSINADNAPVEDVLRQIFKGQEIESRLSGNKIYVSKKAPQQTTASAQGTVRGFVRDINGEPLAGAGIVVKGTKKGVVADLDGRFSINVPAGTTLEVSYLGYVTQSVSAKTGRDLVVVLQSDMNFLDELVVVGYGTQRKRNVVGAVENVGGEILENKSGSFMTRSLQGQIPGLNLTFRDGKPTTSASLQIRGTTQSIGAGGTALVIIDGVEGDLTTINPEDIESISVLKDASSAAVYGARGAFGVILLTTKKATEGKVTVDYNGSYQIYQETVRPTYVTDSKTWYENTMIAYDGAQHRTPPQLGNLFPWSQEWEDEFYRRINDPDNSYLPWDIGPDGRYRYYGRNNDWYNAYYKK
ncbi:MAG: carboxypeptidase-like regulatory domain-containing protein, partial [Bacteroidales bacterium]|nr:carboxypeptidase-like regulatory domain-containing protein [Bacteroidales bacterium]